MSTPDEIVRRAVVAEAEEALRRAARWQLPPQRWARVDAAVTELVTALESGDPDAIRAATAHLELAGPTRIARLGQEPPPQSAPAPIRDRIVRIVDRTAPSTPAEDDDLDADTH